MSVTTDIQAFNKRVRLKNSAPVALTGAADNTVTWDTEDIDTDSMHEGVTNPARITFTTAGDYVVGANLVTSSAQALRVTIKFNAGGTVIADVKNSPGPTACGVYAKTIYTFAAGDYVYVVANPAAGTNMTASSSFFAYRVG